MKLLVVIPTFNEAENLPRIVAALFALPLPDLHLLVVDDGSPDGTGVIADALKKKYPDIVEVIHRPGKLGLGTAYITGFKHGLAQGYDLIAQMDADFSHPPEKLLEFLQAIERGAEVAVGSRYIPGGSLDEKWPLWRKALSVFGNLYSRTILALPVHDVTGGYRLWTRALLARMPLDGIRSNGYVFQVEMIHTALKCGGRYEEIPFHFPDRKFGKSKMSIRISLEAAVNVWRLLRNHPKGTTHEGDIDEQDKS